MLEEADLKTAVIDAIKRLEEKVEKVDNTTREPKYYLLTFAFQLYVLFAVLAFPSGSFLCRLILSRIFFLICGLFSPCLSLHKCAIEKYACSPVAKCSVVFWLLVFLLILSGFRTQCGA